MSIIDLLNVENPNAFPIDHCVLTKAHFPDGLFYGKYQCINDSRVMFTDYGTDKTCTTNTSAPIYYDYNSSIAPGETGYFHCGGETNYQSIKTCTAYKSDYDASLIGNGFDGGRTCCQNTSDSVLTTGCFSIYLATEVCYHDSSRGLWHRYVNEP